MGKRDTEYASQTLTQEAFFLLRFSSLPPTHQNSLLSITGACENSNAPDRNKAVEESPFFIYSIKVLRKKEGLCFAASLSPSSCKRS